ncbi:MAG: threonine/serine dehydratase [Pseudomonadota bacterium]
MTETVGAFDRVVEGEPDAVSVDDVIAASERISGFAARTPLLTYASLNEQVGASVYVKPENLQRSGSFKFRGAFNRLSQLSDDERSSGVVAWSSGNHAQGIAAAAQILGIRAAIVMPEDAPLVKAEKTHGYGAEIISYDRYTESREEIGAALARERGAVLVPSYDDLHIISGQGTCGFEIAQQADELGVGLDHLLVCCGGGGLVAGTSVAMKAMSPDTEIYSVEPDGFDDHKRSFVSGQRETNSADARSICDALLAPTPGALTFPINRANLAGGLSVSDDEVRAAIRFAFSEMKLVVEPGGAVTLAALLAGKLDVAGQSVGIVLSGGNVDPSLFSDIIGNG